MSRVDGWPYDFLYYDLISTYLGIKFFDPESFGGNGPTDKQKQDAIEQFGHSLIHEIINDESVFDEQQVKELQNIYGQFASASGESVHRYKELMKHFKELLYFDPEPFAVVELTDEQVKEETKTFMLGILKQTVSDDRVLSADDREVLFKNLKAKGYSKEEIYQNFILETSKNNIFE